MGWSSFNGGSEKLTFWICSEEVSTDFAEKTKSISPNMLSHPVTAGSSNSHPFSSLSRLADLKHHAFKSQPNLIAKFNHLHSKCIRLGSLSYF